MNNNGNYNDRQNCTKCTWTHLLLPCSLVAKIKARECLYCSSFGDIVENNTNYAQRVVWGGWGSRIMSSQQCLWLCVGCARVFAKGFFSPSFHLTPGTFMKDGKFVTDVAECVVNLEVFL